MKAQNKTEQLIENGYFLTDSDEPLDLLPVQTFERVDYSDFDLPRPKNRFDESFDWYLSAFDPMH
jgi:hypothetical protein